MSGLTGKRVVVTRAPHQAEELATLLRERDAKPLLYPCIDIAPPEDSMALDDALKSAANGGFDCLLLTSANTVIALTKRLTALSLPFDCLQMPTVGVVGPATAQLAQNMLGLKSTVMPEGYTTIALAVALRIIPEMRILLPQSAIANDVLAATLTGAGAKVTNVDAYRTVIGSGGVDLPAMLAANEVDAITFASSSAVHHFLTRLSSESGSASDVAQVTIACIGPSTAQTASECGLSVDVKSREHTLPALVAELASYFENRGLKSPAREREYKE
ncbi:MAG: uroporphyrinogen-III synthase [Burkholderiales bacterium]|nr:uroporphyrinogen-III synthase [Anaerolineae bacterium]